MTASNANNVVRAAVLGADRAFPLPDDRGSKRPPHPNRPKDDVPPCPITPLGDLAGKYFFLDQIGQERHITARGFGNVGEVRGLFRGDESWLRQCWPEYGRGKGGENITGFVIDWAAAWLQRYCCAQGLYNENLKFRKPGIWRGEGHTPIVHCGDVVLVNDHWESAGVRTGSQFWIAGSPTARPALPCDVSVGREFVQEIQRLWKFERAGAPQLIVGWLACGLLGTSIWWRPDLMFTGQGSSGKTALARAMQAACPMNAFSNDASESGIMGEVAGHVMPIFLDEAFDRLDEKTAGRFLDMILGMSSGDGSRKTRGTADGGYRVHEMAGCVLFSSVNPPSMRQTHLGRVTMIEMHRPDGEDHEAAHRAMIDWARLKGPSLWGRVISSAERYHASLPAFRTALQNAGCAPREMDQLGALLTGWWILTEQGVADEAAGRVGTALAKDFIRTAADIELDSAPRNAARHLMSRLLQFDGSTRRELVSVLLERAWHPYSDTLDPEKSQEVAEATLRRYGLRAIRPCLRFYTWRKPVPSDPDYLSEGGGNGPEAWRPNLNAPGAPSPDDRCHDVCCFSKRVRKYVPRMGNGAGLFVAAGAGASLFKDAPGLDGDRWKTELARLGRWWPGTVRIASSERAIWLPREEVDDGGG